jgi:hypothetical protein
MYRTNHYSMMLAIFVGLNNQTQNMVFAQALIRDERTDTFERVLQHLKACMDGNYPITIFTCIQNG